MNKYMSRTELEAASVPLHSFLGDRFADFPTFAPAKHNGPFSKRPEGRARRQQRRAAIARKMEFLNG